MNLKILLWFMTLSSLINLISSEIDEVDRLSQLGLQNLINYTQSQDLEIEMRCLIEKKMRCDRDPNHDLLGIRMEWSSLSEDQRKNYTKAVKCLQSRPSRTPSREVPGSRSRYDDFLATHINQTLSIHGTGSFLPWHRYFLSAYERALREECGYDGYQPYWNWAKYTSDPIHSTVFDGGPGSMSGDGEYVPHQALYIPNYLTPLIKIPPGRGGGCVRSGPFKNMTVNLGPVLLNGFFSGKTGFDYNPRCLRRDISKWVAHRWTKTSDIISLLLQHHHISSFQTTMQGEMEKGSLGVHGGGHFTVGGDPGGDFFCSPGDPIFWLHHAMIDRLWWIWQNLDLETRGYAIAGSRTMFNLPPSRNSNLEDHIDLGYNAPPIQILDMMSTTSGALWYIYG